MSATTPVGKTFVGRDGKTRAWDGTRWQIVKDPTGGKANVWNAKLNTWVHMGSGSGMPINDNSKGQGYSRFRSFAERYLIERSSGFTKGKELEEGWQCIEDAKKLYGMMAAADQDAGQAEQEANIEQIKRDIANQKMLVAKTTALKAPPTHAGPYMPGSPEVAEAIEHLKSLHKAGVTVPKSFIEHFYNLMKGKTP